MPEGHAIHRLAWAFRDLFVGQKLTACSPQGRFTHGAELITDRVLDDAQAWGKHLFHYFGDDIVHTHLGLYGSWRFAGDATFTSPHVIGAPRKKDDRAMPATSNETFQIPPPRGQVRLRLVGSHGVADLTGPNQCRVITALEQRQIRDRLGPDPLRTDADAQRFIDAARASRRPIGQLVMDQAIIAGAGNIYRAECLFRVGIHPWRPGARVATHRLQQLWDDLVETMGEGLKTGRIDTIRTEDVPAGSTVKETRWYVYHRDGLPCFRCGAQVVVEQMAGRKLYRCPGCQR
ncbi:MAG: Fpg/Nei family DNA glycosylase [Bowdeniella nasicola]|nr:Fpg/Nei family DNA glycosylase [Bowdeniella nasicola]